MGLINVLDKDTINQIAAGEVIEGPSAVVKELVENAIDADANSVTVEIRNGGISLIRVTDNGKGIESDDIKTAFLPHATSKIKTAPDLLTVSSLGFRGEALASIAAVSEVEVLTKTAYEISGIRYLISGGKELALEPCGTPEGTTFVVRNIFYNTPARKKFLKTPSTEGRYVVDVMEHMALSHPEIAFKFIMNGQIKLQTLGTGSLKDVLFYIYGKETTGNIIAVNDPDVYGELLNGFSVRGYIGKPSLTRGNREYENYFINGRFIKNKVITRAIEDAYKPFLMQHRYPFTCLLISVDNSIVDVNVHPAKLEVRFTDTNGLYKLIFNEVDGALRKRNLLRNVASTPVGKELVREFNPDRKEEKSTYIIPDIPMPEPFEKKGQDEWKNKLKPVFKQGTFIGSREEKLKNEVKVTLVSEAEVSSDADNLKDKVKEDSSYMLGNNKTESNGDSDNFTIPKTEIDKGLENISESEPLENTVENTEYKGGILDKKALPDIKIIGQVFNTYWIMEYNGSVYMVDQHAAHEKILYEKFLKEIENGKIHTQNLMPQMIITLSESQRLIVDELKDYLLKLGFEVEKFSGNDYVVKTVPIGLLGISGKEAFFDIIDQYSLERKKVTPDTMLSKIATMSCKAAIKGNTRISSLEAKAIIEELMELENPYNCPHGRPTMLYLSKSEVEKKFKRKL